MAARLGIASPLDVDQWRFSQYVDLCSGLKRLDAMVSNGGEPPINMTTQREYEKRKAAAERPLMTEPVFYG